MSAPKTLGFPGGPFHDPFHAAIGPRLLGAWSLIRSRISFVRPIHANDEGRPLAPARLPLSLTGAAE